MKCPECGTEDFMPEAGCIACGYLLASLMPERLEASHIDGTQPPDQEKASPGEDRVSSEDDTLSTDEDMRSPDEDMPLEQLNEMLTALGITPLTDPEVSSKPVAVEEMALEADALSTDDVGSTPAIREPLAVDDLVDPESTPVSDGNPMEKIEPDGRDIEKSGVDGNAIERIEPGMDDGDLNSLGEPVPPSGGAARKALLAARYVAGPSQRLKTVLHSVTRGMAGIPVMVLAFVKRVGTSTVDFREGIKRLLARLVPGKRDKTPDEPLPEAGPVSAEADVADAAAVTAEEVVLAEDAVAEAVIVEGMTADLSVETLETNAAQSRKTLSPMAQKMVKTLFWIGIPVLAILLTIGLLFFVLALRESRLTALEQPVEQPLVEGYVPWTPAPDPQIEPFRVVGE